MSNNEEATRFNVTFTNQQTGVAFTDTFTLQELFQARLCTDLPEVSATALVAWIQRLDVNRQTAYACVRVWREEFRDKAS